MRPMQGRPGWQGQERACARARGQRATGGHYGTHLVHADIAKALVGLLVIRVRVVGTWLLERRAALLSARLHA